MQKNTIKYIILFLLILGNGFVKAQSIGLRIPDTTVVQGNTIDIPIYADNSLTGNQVLSYQFQIGYDPYYFQAISVITSGTISQQLGTPTVNLTIPGQVSMAAAGTSALSGAGKFIYLRFLVLHTGWTSITFTHAQQNYLNEGTPSVSLQSGDITITPKPVITITPDNEIIAIGDQLQMQVDGGTPPYQWFVTNSSIASISSSGVITATQSGFTKVVVVDQDGIRDTTNQNIEIRPLKLSIPDTLTQWKNAFINVPVYTSSLNGLNITSGNLKINVDTNILKPVGVVQTGTLLASYGTPTTHILPTGSVSIGFAGTTPLSGSGILLYVRFQVSGKNSGSTHINLSEIIFNQNISADNNDGYFTTKEFEVISITPNTASVITGQSLQFAVEGNAFPPYTWSISDTSLASIDASGLMTAKKNGTVIISVRDNVGASASSGHIRIYDTRITLPDTSACTLSNIFYYPVFIEALPSQKSVSSIEANITFDTTCLNLLELESNGTLTQGWTYATNPSVGKLKLAASGLSAFHSEGVLFQIKFEIKTNLTPGLTTQIQLKDVLLNEGFPLPIINEYGQLSAGNTPNTPDLGNITQPTCTEPSGTIEITNLPPTGTWTLHPGDINGSGTSTIITGMVPGTYHYTVTNESGCTSDSSAEIIIDPIPNKPATPVITLIGNTLHSDASSGNQWYNQNGIINQATDQNFTPVEDGDYYVIVSVSGCSSDPSNSINVVISGIHLTDAADAVELFPNPASETTTIIMQHTLQPEVVINIYNIMGNLIQTEKCISDHHRIDLRNLTNGVYYVELKTEDKTHKLKLIIQR